ncbi:hypothetical protein [Actinomadura sp. WMMB 499]|uniref:hypothetical protein n=1 Tax=Actinomadura sp. WMMB 499 TaxID=1219491 RepID=UPI0012478821|nr:hypothetical protein [Actinomadura sp. WMMB 499]QFG23470.1 hypothetical protein F7P10_22475 [Actinomadura sp. WMMB 499]
MTPGSLVLLHAPNTGSAAWGDLPETLRSYGLDVIVPDVAEGTGSRYVARAALIIAATAPATPLVLAAHGAAGPLLPAIALAQRAAHRTVGGYLFVDAELPRPAQARDHDHEHGHGGAAAPPEHVPSPPDWPDAPCAYLRTHADRSASPEHDRAVREARLRGWPVTEHEPPTAVAQSLSELLTTL